MLKYFSAKNFKQFKSKIEINFADIRDYTFNKECINNGLIKDAIIYGKNASGKTNFGRAIMDIVYHLTDKMKKPDHYLYYANADAIESPVEFVYIFSFGKKEVEYKYKKNKSGQLLSESFKVNKKNIFSFDFKTQKKDITTVKAYKLNTLNWEFRDSGISVLRYIVNNTQLDKKNPLRLVMSFVNGMLWFRTLGEENSFVGLKSNPEVLEDFIITNGLVGDFEKFINEYGVNEKLKAIENLPERKMLYFNHKTLVPFTMASSSGTKSLINLYYWYKHIDEATFVFIDEFDAYYHFELAEKVVKLMIEKVKAQVIFTSHNTNLLTNRLMRPDCYFILTRGELKSFANSTNREIREGNNIEKLFIGGEFGA